MDSRRRHSKSRRSAMIAKIHVGIGQLGIDDDSYRAMLVRIAGVTTSTRMNELQLGMVLAELEAKGFRPRPAASKKSRPRPARDRAALRSKVTALLADAGRPEEYADSMAKRMFRIDSVDFLTADQLWRLVAALQIDANRHGRGSAK